MEKARMEFFTAEVKRGRCTRRLTDGLLYLAMLVLSDRRRETGKVS